MNSLSKVFHEMKVPMLENFKKVGLRVQIALIFLLEKKKFCDIKNGGRSHFFTGWVFRGALLRLANEGLETTIRPVPLITTSIFCLHRAFLVHPNQSKIGKQPIKN